MQTFPLPEISDSDILAHRQAAAEFFGLHPVSLLASSELVDETTTHSQYEDCWRYLGFEIRKTVDDGWDDKTSDVRGTDPEYGIYLPMPPVVAGWVRVEAFATEDGDCVYYDVRPATGYAETLQTTMGALGWPEPRPETA